MRLLVLLMACANGDWLAELRTRAAYDFQCAEAKIALEEIAPGTVGARGCGKQASYVTVCAGPCRWVH